MGNLLPVFLRVKPPTPHRFKIPPIFFGPERSGAACPVTPVGEGSDRSRRTLEVEPQSKNSLPVRFLDVARNDSHGFQCNSLQRTATFRLVPCPQSPGAIA
jgi:hypothetical protein